MSSSCMFSPLVILITKSSHSWGVPQWRCVFIFFLTFILCKDTCCCRPNSLSSSALLLCPPRSVKAEPPVISMPKVSRSTVGHLDEGRRGGDEGGEGGAITVPTNSFYPFQRDGWLEEESLDFLNLKWKRKSDRRSSGLNPHQGGCVC